MTVEDIQETIAHFSKQETCYQKELQEQRSNPATPYRVSYLEKSVRIMQSRQHFWSEMLTRKSQGEKIRSHVREYVAYCKQTGEF